MSSIGMDDGGKKISEKDGMRPNAVGPKMIPANISATTKGSFTHLYRE
jgi:hypothetical protein